MKKIKFRSFKKYQSENFNSDLKTALDSSELKTLIENKDVNKATDLLVKLITQTANTHAPLIDKKVADQKIEPPGIHLN